jgi:chemotaxis protein methyltransferase CheR
VSAERRSLPKATPTITEGEFALLRDLIYRESGIHLGPGKSSLLVARLGRRLRDLDLDSFGTYYARVLGGDARELATMIDRITTNETQFFRERLQFEFLESSVFPEWRRQGQARTRPKRVNVWSAACSTGEEAYSLAMSLLWHFPRKEGWSVAVLGSDISTRVLHAARNAEWPVERASTIPARYLNRFMLRGVRSRMGHIRASDELRSAVDFERVNLNDDTYLPRGSYDLILARNVLIYFADTGRAEAIRRLASWVSPGGYLLLGHAEHGGGVIEGLERVRPTIYRASARATARRNA